MRLLWPLIPILSLATLSAAALQPTTPQPTPATPPKADPPKVDPPKPTTPPAPAAPDPKPDSKPTTPDAAKPAAPATPPAKAKLVPQPDGSTLVDDKYVIKGKGTKDDPYRITWEMLVSAQETYQPRLGRKNIPDRVMMLNGKWIKIGGYIAFPLMAQSADEMLMMLNQWDGCCIGVPPTPYDAIEVKLKKAAKGDDRLRTTGTLTGILRVDPYLVKDWLVSLYVMDDGELSEVAGQVVTPATHGAK